ncbi:TA system VapC family ribonuclease toxin [Haloechinothrix sp. LS1_15]|uniref:TA system VapC family ribonuclease toxin n=1 Tax=Haloechinothrix sp. LS1_15 TaxID=2652248 RepID=UPI0029451479|nr:TA system VapC family ribonuclease toxin [Haloechinothrix sp. LS1_15]MDV6011876.1 VapC toxin family PIN domain ribonuclease [Haloechinothrix sp. LS1_15]
MLLDVGVWLAALWQGHVHHQRVAPWFDDHDGELVLCRVSQMGVLRLLCNSAVMGDDVLTRATSWTVIDRLRSDERVRFAPEPPQLEQVWRALSAREDNSHKLWTDDYLAAFAQAADRPLVTLDTAFVHRYRSISVHSLL